MNDDDAPTVTVGTVGRTSMLRAAAGQFAAAGFPDEFRRTRAAADAIEELEAEAAGRRHAIEELEAAIVRRLAEGAISVEAADIELASATVGSDRVDAVVGRALSGMRRQLGSGAAAEAAAAIGRLVPLVNEATAEAVRAGRECVDVAAIVRSFRGHSWRYEVPTLVAGAENAAGWPAAVAASGRVLTLRHLVSVATKAGGPPVAAWERRPPVDEPARVSELVPVPLQPAVADGLGWGARLQVKPGPPVPLRGDDGARAAELAAIAAAPRTGALHRAVNALAGWA